MGRYGYPEVYGTRQNGTCGHCRGLPEHSSVSERGTFCLACFRWRSYSGPPQLWGDGMRTGHDRPVPMTEWARQDMRKAPVSSPLEPTVGADENRGLAVSCEGARRSV